jgi:hypothetical protein
VSPHTFVTPSEHVLAASGVHVTLQSVSGAHLTWQLSACVQSTLQDPVQVTLHVPACVQSTDPADPTLAVQLGTCVHVTVPLAPAVPMQTRACVHVTVPPAPTVPVQLWACSQLTVAPAPVVAVQPLLCSQSTSQPPVQVALQVLSESQVTTAPSSAEAPSQENEQFSSNVQSQPKPEHVPPDKATHGGPASGGTETASAAECVSGTELSTTTWLPFEPPSSGPLPLDEAHTA